MNLIKVKLALPSGDKLIANRYVADGSGQWTRLLDEMSELSRSVTIDRSFERGGFTLTIDDTTGAFQDIMEHADNRKIYGSVVTVYAYGHNDSTIDETLTATIHSWERNEKKFIVHCVQEFAGKMNSIASPTTLTITLTDWPNAEPKAVGRPVPMPSGAVDTERGGVVAWRVNSTPGAGNSDTNVQFLVTWSDPGGTQRVTTVDEVYHRGVLLAPTKYSFARDGNGWELITFAQMRKPVAKRLGVNVTCTNLSATGNPVPYLRDVLTDAGVTLVDDGDGGSSDSDFEDWCSAHSWAIRGVIPDTIATVQEYLEAWCHNFDCFWRVDAAGQVHIKHIDWSSVSADATLYERHFIEFSERSTMEGFCNRIKAKFNYDPSESEWGASYSEDSTAGDYLPATTPIELEDEYSMFAYTVGAETPLAGKLRFIDCPIQVMTGTIDLYQYVTLGIGLLGIVTVTHSDQIGGSGKYLIMGESIDYAAGTVTIEARRLWGA